jgi:hypothetical protein
MAENAAATPQPAWPASEGAVLLESGRAPTRSGDAADATACSSGDGESCYLLLTPFSLQRARGRRFTRTEGMCSAGEMGILLSSFLLILSDLLLCPLSEVGRDFAFLCLFFTDCDWLEPHQMMLMLRMWR